MNHGLSTAEAGKAAASIASVALVEDGMKLGLGTGSTANWMLRALAARQRKDGLHLTCAATSARTAHFATSLGLNVRPLNDLGVLDLTIDGTDEFDPALNLIKGGGGAHLREKIVARASHRMVVITDPSKDVASLGAFPLPVEVVHFGSASTLAQIETVLAGLGYASPGMSVRGGDAPFHTDEGNLIVDLQMQKITDARALSAALLDLPGVVETGLFLGMCDAVVIGHADGRAEIRNLDGSRKTDHMDLSGVSTLPPLPSIEGLI